MRRRVLPKSLQAIFDEGEMTHSELLEKKETRETRRMLAKLDASASLIEDDTEKGSFAKRMLEAEQLREAEDQLTRVDTVKPLNHELVKR